jgi:hypothetical protein
MNVMSEELSSDRLRGASAQDTLHRTLRVTRLRFGRLLITAIGAALGLDRVTGASAAQCRKKSARCDRSDQCCSNRCRRGFCYPRRR